MILPLSVQHLTAMFGGAKPTKCQLNFSMNAIEFVANYGQYISEIRMVIKPELIPVCADAKIGSRRSKLTTPYNLKRVIQIKDFPFLYAKS